MTKTIVVFILAVASSFGQPANCSQSATLTSATAGTSLNNRLGLSGACNLWKLQYYSTGFSAISISLQGAPDNGSGAPGTWADVSSTFVQVGSNPLTGTGSGFLQAQNYYAWMRVNLGTATGSGSVKYDLKGFNSNVARAGSAAAVTASTAFFKGFGPIFPLTDPTLQTWTWINQGTATRDDVSQAGVIYLETPYSATTNFRLLVKSAPVSTPWKARFGYIPHNDGFNFQRTGVIMRDSSTGKFTVLYFLQQNTGWKLDRWTDAIGGGGSVVNAGTALGGPMPMLWIEVADNGTNRSFSYSADGIHFHTLLSEARNAASMTADQVGVMLSTDETSVSATVGLTLLSYKEL
jgi:hypothetical protein